MTYPSYFIEIVKALYAADSWLEPYAFYEQNGLSPLQVAEAASELATRDLIEFTENLRLIRLKPAGYRWVDEHAAELFMAPRAAGAWRATSKKAKTEEYIPSPSRLELEFLTELGSGAL